MASLTGNLVAETYKALLKTIDNDILTASEKQITDGLGGGSNVFIDSNGFLRANKYKVTNGLATQFLKADGSLDANTYLTSITGAQVITALGYTPVTNARTLTINGTTYDLTANRSWTIAGTSAVWGNITGTLSNQTDLQTALNAKFNNPTGTVSQYIRGDGSIATFPTLPGGLPTGGTAGQILAKIDATDYNAHWIDNFATQTKNEVKLGATLAKGTAVYVSGSTGGSGTNMIVMAASNASEALSSKTFGLLETGGATNDFVKCVTFGLIAGLDTSTAQAGDPVWLGVNGALLFGVANKPVAPANMVYIGVVTRVQSNNGEIFVNVQNGFEIEELHDVLITSKANNQGLFYESSTGLWKNKSIATVLGYTPQAQLNGTGFVKASGTTISYDNSTYLTTADAASTYQLLTNLSTDLTASATKYPSVNAVIAGLATKQNQLNGTGLVRMSGTTVSYDNNSYVTGSGSIGYISSWNATTGLTNSSLFESSGSIGLNITNVNYSAYGRAFTGASFAASSFGYEIASGATADGGLLGGLAYVLISNDASRRIGAKIESNVVGTTATNLGANLRFYVKADNAAIAEIARMTASGVTFYSGITATSFVKTGGTSNEYLRADGSVNVITGDIVSGSGTAGYIAKFNSSAVIASSNLFESAANIGFGTITLNYGSYGRAFTGAGFGSTAFGFEAVTGSTTNGGLIGGLSLVIASNDSTRRIGSAIQSYISGATSTHQGADLRFFVKPDNGVLLEVVRMTSAGITFNKDLTAANINATTFVKSGGTASEFLMADGSVSTYTNPVTGTGSSGYIPKWTSASNLGSSFMYDDGTSIGIAYTTPNKGGYGRALSGAAFGSASFGFEAVSNTTTNGGLIGGLSFIVNQNDSSRIVGSAIQSNLVGTTATNYGADLRFFAKADGVFTIGEVARMTSAGLRVYGTIVKDGGTGSQYLMADGSVTTFSGVTGSGTTNYLPKWTSASALGNSILFETTGFANIAGDLKIQSLEPQIYLNKTGTDAGTWRILGSTGQSLRRFRIYDEAAELDRFDIFSSGNVSIGTTTDGGYKFDVNGTARFINSATVSSTSNAVLTAVTNSTTGFSFIDFINNGASGKNFQIGIAGNAAAAGYANNLYIDLVGSGNIITLTSSRNVLIGTQTDAGFRLDVNGTARFSGNTTIGFAAAATNVKLIFNGVASKAAGIEFQQSGSPQWYIGNGIASEDNNFELYNSNGTMAMKIIKSTNAINFQGSATFSNSVTANTFVEIVGDLRFNSSSADRSIYFRGSTGSVDGNWKMGNYITPTGATIVTLAATVIDVFNGAGYGFMVRNTSNAPLLQIAGNTGAATFLNSVTSTGLSVFGQTDLCFVNAITTMRIARSGSVARFQNYDGGSVANISLNWEGGNVGIGTSAPTEKLHLNNASGAGSFVRFQDTSGGGVYIGGRSENMELYAGGAERIKIFANGNTFIGSSATDSGFKLEVNGTLRTSGDILTSSTLKMSGNSSYNWMIQNHNDSNWGFGMFNSGAQYYPTVYFSGDGTNDRGFRVRNVNGGTNSFLVNSLGNGTFLGSVTATSFFESSDIRLKKLIDGSPQIAGIENLEAKLYEKDGKLELGYFAQDAEKLMPYAVTKGTDGFLSLSYREVHTAKIARLEKEVAELKAKLNAA